MLIIEKINILKQKIPKNLFVIQLLSLLIQIKK